MQRPLFCTVLMALSLHVCCIKLQPLENNELTDNNLLPTSFSECVKLYINPSTPQHIIQAIQVRCLDGFISIDHTHDWTANFTKDEQLYIRSIFRKVIQDAGKVTKRNNRKKREAGYFPRGIRREVREDYQAWLNYAKNVKRLKYEAIMPNGRSKYDIIADLHGTAINSAHFGPSFLSWHRLYLIVIESALGVPVPFWDSTIDFEMNDPTQSILWTSKYFGNGFGVVKTGPFAHFETPLGKLFRNIGSDGCLFNHRGLMKIFSRCRLAEVSTPTADEGYSIEEHHNDIHIWVDGQMNNIEVSPHDPVFFTHHSFVDHIWETFRNIQYRKGIDPTIDYVQPPNNVTFQNFTDPAVALTGWYVNDGHSEMVASMIKFAARPKCPHCCNSPDLYCDKRKHVCVSKMRDPDEYMGNQGEAMESAQACGIVDGGPKSHPFPMYERDNRCRMDSVTMHYDRNGNNGNGVQGNNFWRNGDLSWAHERHSNIAVGHGLSAMNQHTLTWYDSGNNIMLNQESSSDSNNAYSLVGYVPASLYHPQSTIQTTHVVYQPQSNIQTTHVVPVIPYQQNDIQTAHVLSSVQWVATDGAMSKSLY